MSRTPMNENIIRRENMTKESQSDAAYADSQKALGEYQGNMGKLERGGEVGANPWESPGYLSNLNQTAADAVSGENSAAKQNLEMQNRRSGGQNTGAVNADITSLAGNKSRMLASLLTKQKSEDFGKNQNWQQYLASSPLAVAGQEGNLFGTATGGESSTASDMEKFAELQQQNWYKQINQMIQAGVSAASMGTSAATGGAGVGGFGEG